jgi:hypothetical protein
MPDHDSAGNTPFGVSTEKMCGLYYLWAANWQSFLKEFSMRTLTMSEVQDVNGAWVAFGINIVSTGVYNIGEAFVNAVRSCSGYADPSDVYTSGGWVG